MRSCFRSLGRRVAITTVVVAAIAVWLPFTGADVAGATGPAATTPITHLVVIFQENVSFDHYFATYPNATNTSGQSFTGTTPNGAPVGLGGPVNNLANTIGAGSIGNLLTNNPNSSPPQRFDPALDSNVLTCSVNHSYKPEQQAFDLGNMDKFPENVGVTSARPTGGGNCTKPEVMNYYDGNTVTAFWNYAQHFAMSDNDFNTIFGPSTPGAVNLVSGDTGAVDTTHSLPQPFVGGSNFAADGLGGFSVIGDARPYYDDCQPTKNAATSFQGLNIGDELNSAGLSWGWFQGGYTPTTPYTGAANDHTNPYDNLAVQNSGTQAQCATTHKVGTALGGTGTTGAKPYGTTADYIAHHEPFDYYASTANPHHRAPTSLAAIGTDTQHFDGSTPEFDTANHNYDMSYFDQLVSAIAQGTQPNSLLPAVSFLKAPAYEDGHQAYSDPLDEQAFVTKEINALEQTPDWAHTAVVINYDDSDGWYDHVWSGAANGGQPQNSSQTTSDALTGTNACGTSGSHLAGEQGRCGYGPRTPLLVISPCAKANFVDHTLVNQASVTKWIEDNWSLPAISGSFDATSGTLNNMFDFSGQGCANPVLYLSASTGQVTQLPDPVLPDSRYPAIFAGLGAITLGGGTIIGIKRRARRATNPA
jgi:phospholipase C